MATLEHASSGFDPSARCRSSCAAPLLLAAENSISLVDSRKGIPVSADWKVTMPSDTREEPRVERHGLSSSSSWSSGGSSEDMLDVQNISSIPLVHRTSEPTCVSNTASSGMCTNDADEPRNSIEETVHIVGVNRQCSPELVAVNDQSFRRPTPIPSPNVSRKNDVTTQISSRPLPEIPRRTNVPRRAPLEATTSMKVVEIRGTPAPGQSPSPPPRRQSSAARTSRGQAVSRTPSPFHQGPNGVPPTPPPRPHLDSTSIHAPLCRAKASPAPPVPLSRTPLNDLTRPFSPFIAESPTTQVETPALGDHVPALPIRAPKAKVEVKFRSESVPENMSYASDPVDAPVFPPTSGNELSPQPSVAVRERAASPISPIMKAAGMTKNMLQALSRSISQPQVSVIHQKQQSSSSNGSEASGEAHVTLSDVSIFDFEQSTQPNTRESGASQHQQQESISVPVDTADIDVIDPDSVFSIRLRPAFHDDRGSVFWQERCSHLEAELQQCRAMLEAKNVACQQLQEQLTMVRKNMSRMSASCSALNDIDPSVAKPGVDICDLSLLQVCKLLAAYDLAQYTKVFQEHGVDGAAFSALTHHELESRLGIRNRLHRNKILRLSSGCLS